MKNLASILAIAALAISSGHASEGGIAASVTLRDSSIVKGDVVEAEALKGAVAFESEARLPLAMVRTMEADGTNGAQVVTLVNGDKFHFTPTTKALSVASVLGDLSIPLANIRRVDFSARRANPSGSLLFHCTFDSPEAVEKPAVGPGGTVGNASISKGKFGNAMFVPRYGSAGVFRFPKGFLKASGCVEFWARLDTQKEVFSSCDPRFFVLRLPPRREFFVEFSSNNGAGKGGLHVRLFSLCATSSNRMGNHAYSEILGGDTTAWHHYAVSWSEESTVPMVFIDGRPLRMDGIYPGSLDQNVIETSTSVLSFPNDPAVDDGTQPQCAFLIDDFKIWNYCKTDFSLDD